MSGKILQEKITIKDLGDQKLVDFRVLCEGDENKDLLKVQLFDTIL